MRPSDTQKEKIAYLSSTQNDAHAGLRTVSEKKSATTSRAGGMIGVGKSFRSPRPPNRACGSPAHGSPVGGFNIVIGTPLHGLRSW
jgi:hypothetical protein